MNAYLVMTSLPKALEAIQWESISLMAHSKERIGVLFQISTAWLKLQKQRKNVASVQG